MSASIHLRLAFLGDIHGNLPALEAVVQDIAQQQQPDAVFLLGDLVNRCPWTVEVMDLLAAQGWPGVQGNHDLVLGLLNTPQIWHPFDERGRFPVIYWTWERLRPVDIQQLQALPHDLLIETDDAPAIRLFHGLPGNPFEGITPGADSSKIQNALAVYDEPLLICGHTHQPLNRLFDGQRVLNPGSVGMPYNRDPRAQYLLLDLTTADGTRQWQAHFRQIEYDRAQVEQAFHQRGLLDESSPIARLYLRTVQDAHPWASDFGQWLRHQSMDLRRDPSQAVELYLQSHGPGRWAFSG